MKNVLILIVLFVSQNALALNMTYKLEVERKEPVVAMMTCSGQSCACPADTTLDQTQMRCLKCDAGFQLDAGRKCVDPKATAEETIVGWTAFDPQINISQTLLDQESSSPTLCDVTKMVDGKFTECQCPATNLEVSQSESLKVSLTIVKSFKQDSQKCERSRPYTVKVANISCYGPRRDAFQNLEVMGLIKSDYDDPGFSLASCGATDGTHILELQRSENMVSILDAIIATTSLSSQSSRGKIKSFAIDPKSLNY